MLIIRYRDRHSETFNRGCYIFCGIIVAVVFLLFVSIMISTQKHVSSFIIPTYYPSVSQKQIKQEPEPRPFAGPTRLTKKEANPKAGLKAVNVATGR